MTVDEKYFSRQPFEFTKALRKHNISKLGLNLVSYMQEQTYKRWIKNKTTNSSPLDWIDYNQRHINRECWGINNTTNLKRALKCLTEKNIIVFNEHVSKIRINYKIETWNI